MTLLTWQLGYRSYNVLEPVLDALRADSGDVLNLSRELAGVLLQTAHAGDAGCNDDVAQALGFVIAARIVEWPEYSRLSYGLSRFHKHGESIIQGVAGDVLRSGIGVNGDGMRGELRALAERYVRATRARDELDQALARSIAAFGFLSERDFPQLAFSTTFRFRTDGDWHAWRKVLVEHAPRTIALFEWAANYDLRRREEGTAAAIWERDFEINLRRIYAGWIIDVFAKSSFLWGWYYQACCDVNAIDWEADGRDLVAVKHWGNVGKRLGTEQGEGQTGRLAAVEGEAAAGGGMTSVAAKRAAILQDRRRRNAGFWHERMKVAAWILAKRDWFLAQGRDGARITAESLRRRLYEAEGGSQLSWKALSGAIGSLA